MAGLDRAILAEGRGLLRNVLRDARRYPLSYLVGQSLCDWGEWSVRHADDLLTDAAAETAALREQVARVEALCAGAEEDRRVRVEGNPTAMYADAIVEVADVRAALAGPTDREGQS